ncbi:MAG TPA: helix-turn-helix domain-containing protein [Xanthobacteraceae bacterium]|nr:helix-turn-helix domain-containing protein [Xanthobacteraceae bacterium]
MSSFSPVRSVTRALELLSLLNRDRGSSIAELHMETGLPKPTIVRLLETLVDTGYVAKDPGRAEYRVTNSVERLSAGFYGSPLIVQAARDAALDLTRRLKWPITVAVFDNDAMVVLYSTVPESPISPGRPPAFSRYRMLTRAHGISFLAFCSEEQRELIVSSLLKSKHPEDRLANSPAMIARLISEARKHGYAFRDSRVDPKISSSMAVPLVLNGEAIGSLGLTYFTSALSRAQAIERYVPELQKAATSVEDKIRLLMRGRYK